MGSNKPYDKKDDHKRNHFKKKSDEAMHNDQSLSAGQFVQKKESILFQITFALSFLLLVSLSLK
jgi:hypothetical protein